MSGLVVLFKNRVNFSDQCFRFTVKWSIRSRDSPIDPCFHIGTVISIPHQSGIFVTINEPTLTCNYYPEFNIYSSPSWTFRVHSWCHTFCGFEQMYDDMCPSLEYYTGQFYCSKNLYFCLFIHFSNFWKVLMHSFAFSSMSYSWIIVYIYVHRLFRMSPFTLQYAMSLHGLVAHFFLA